MTCDHGHLTYTVVQNDKFELLSKLAVHALADEYHREAVVSFAASLERLYEFFLRVYWRNKGHSESDTDQLWRWIAASSERQLGAFVGCYFSEYGKMPLMLSGKNVAFRNDVIHKGLFPSREEAILFGQAALDIARHVNARLADPGYEQALREVISDKIRRGYQLAGAGTQVAICGLATPFTWMPDIQQLTMEEMVEKRVRMPNMKKFQAEATKLIEQMIRNSQGNPTKGV